MTVHRAEADPAFWATAKCVAVRAEHFVSGAIEHVYRIKSSQATVHIHDSGRRASSPPFSLQAYALKLAAKQRRKGATAAMKAVLPHVARVEAEAKALLPAAEQRAGEVARKRATARETRIRAKNRAAVLKAIRRHADLVEEHEVVQAWREGVIEQVHSF